MTSLVLFASALSQAGDVQAGYIPADLKVAQVILVTAAGLSLPALTKAGLKGACVAFCGGSALGSFLVFLFGQPPSLSMLVIGFAIVLGVLTAVRFSANVATAYIVFSVIGLALAAASAPENGEFPQSLSLMVANVIAGAGAIICLSQIIVILNPERAPPWRSIAVRIAGSWIVAISVLVIAVSSQTINF